MSDTQNEIRCKACGQMLQQVAGGHRKRLFCNDVCKQRYYRGKKQEDIRARIARYRSHTQGLLETLLSEYPGAIEQVFEVLDYERSQEEKERNRLLNAYQERSDFARTIEKQFRQDTSARHFKSWLRMHRPGGTDFAQRFLDDPRLPPQTSRGRYEGLMRLHKYSEEDIFLFRELWKDMLFLRQSEQ